MIWYFCLLIILLAANKTYQSFNLRGAWTEETTILKKLKLLRGHPIENCVCPTIYMPVCGVDGVSYANFCAAKCKSLVSFIEGNTKMICIL